MKICDDVNLEKKEVLSDKKIDEIFLLMLSGKSVTETIKTSRGDFEVRYPKQKGLITIGHIAAFIRNGMPPSAFDASTEYEILKCAALDFMVIGGPTWFEDVKKAPLFSWRDMPDSNFTDEVYAKALSFCTTVKEKLKEVTEKGAKTN